MLKLYCKKKKANQTDQPHPTNHITPHHTEVMAFYDDDEEEKQRLREEKEQREEFHQAQAQMKSMAKLAKSVGIDEKWAVDALISGRQEEVLVKMMQKYGVDEATTLAAYRSGDESKLQELMETANLHNKDDDISESDYSDIMAGFVAMGHDPAELEAKATADAAKWEQREKAKEGEELAKHPHLALLNHRVKVDGLIGRPELNGQFGKAVAFDDEKGRFAIKLEGSRERVLLRPANLEKVPPLLNPPCHSLWRH